VCAVVIPRIRSGSVSPVLVKLGAAVCAAGWTLALLAGPAAAVTTPQAAPAVSPNSVRAFGAAPTFGGARFGSTSPVVGIAANPDGRGYWLVAADGQVRGFGDATLQASLPARLLDTPIVGIAATPDGRGYWIAAAGGGVFAFGDARPFGGNFRIGSPVQGIAATPDGQGYWLVAADGQVRGFGDATLQASLPARLLDTPIVGIAATPDGRGYWIAAAGGGVFAFGDATPHGSLPARLLDTLIVGIAATPDGRGYWLVAAGGGVFAFGDAPYEGQAFGLSGGAPAVGIVAPLDGGYWVAYGKTGVAPLGPGIAGALSNRQGTVTAAVYDARTGQSFVFQPGVAQDTASIVKVDIMSTLLHQVVGSPGALTDAQKSLLAAMIELSDNNAASALWNEVGGASGVAAFDTLEGLVATRPGCCGYWGLTTTTALDQLDLVSHLAAPNTVLDGAQRAYALSLMEHVVPYEAWGVSGGVPTGVTVALKNGWLPLGSSGWQVNSIGWVDGQGRDYVIAVLSVGSPTESYAIATIEGISAQVWAGLDPAHPAPWAS
jgi:hypothetical protein